MYKYTNEDTYIPHDINIFCPKCESEDLKDLGSCGEGCCDDYRCNKCNHQFRIEWPD